jgi:hypothetical protein
VFECSRIEADPRDLLLILIGGLVKVLEQRAWLEDAGLESGDIVTAKLPVPRSQRGLTAATGVDGEVQRAVRRCCDLDDPFRDLATP